MAEPRRQHLQDEDESYFISMTDLMIGMLFVFIIMLMSFALNLKDATEKRDDLKENIQRAENARTFIIFDIKERLRDRGIRVEIDEDDNGILRLPDEEFTFEKAQADISSSARVKLQKVANVLLEVLPCFATPSLPRPSDCSKEYTNVYMEAVFIEGHTDKDKMTEGARYRDNLELSALRSVNTYRELMESEPGLQKLLNNSGEQLIGVSGYGENRPLSNNKQEKEVDKRQNRRIDLRFLMATPHSAGVVIEPVKKRLEGSR